MSIPEPIQLRNFHQKNKGGLIMQTKFLLTLLFITIVALMGYGNDSCKKQPQGIFLSHIFSKTCIVIDRRRFSLQIQTISSKTINMLPNIRT